jgi:hypothetical protein
MLQFAFFIEVIYSNYIENKLLIINFTIDLQRQLFYFFFAGKVRHGFKSRRTYHATPLVFCNRSRAFVKEK